MFLVIFLEKTGIKRLLRFEKLVEEHGMESANWQGKGRGFAE